MKKVFRFGAWSTLVLMLTLVMIGSCVPFDMRKNDAEVDAFFAARNVPFTRHQYTRGQRAMHYAASGEVGRPTVVFVHGSPGSWDNFMHFLTSETLLLRARLISVDRPGFGKSGYGTDQPSLAEQAADIVPLLRTADQPVILVGHSMGGPVVARIAMDYPELVAGLILVAPAIDPQLEKVRWYQHAAEWPLFSWLVPTTLQVTNREILPLQGELEKMLPLWKNVQVPVTVIHGEKDTLVPPGNADFAVRMLREEQLLVVREADLNHFVPWKRPDLIRDAIIRHLDALEANPNQGEAPL